MMEPTSEPTLAGAAARLDRVDASLTAFAKQNRQRNFWMAVLSVATLIFLTFYLLHAYNRFGNEVTPDLVAVNAQSMFQNQMPSARTQLEANLRANAPQYVDKAMDQLENMPASYADRLNKQASDAIDKAMPQVGDELYAALKHSLDDAAQNKMNGTDEQKFQATLAALGQVYSDETTKFVDQAHATYANQSVDFTNYLDLLAQNKNLDRREQLHREMFRNLLTLLHEKANESGSPDMLKINMTQ